MCAVGCEEAKYFADFGDGVDGKGARSTNEKGRTSIVLLNGDSIVSQ